MRTTTRHLPVSTVELQQLIHRALSDLKHARSVDNAAGTAQAERRMNALLDQLAKRMTEAANRGQPLRAAS